MWVVNDFPVYYFAFNFGILHLVLGANFELWIHLSVQWLRSESCITWWDNEGMYQILFRIRVPSVRTGKKLKCWLTLTWWIRGALIVWNNFITRVLLSPVQTDATLVANNSQHCWMLHVASVCTRCCMLLRVVAQNLVKQTFQPTIPTFLLFRDRRSVAQ